MPTTIKLSGSLARRFGREHVRYLESGTVQEAMQALKHTLAGFERAILEMSNKGIEFIVFKNGKNINADDLTERGASEIRILPKIAGSKNGGIFMTIIGVVLIVVGTFVPGAQALVPVGWAMVAGGVIQMLSPQPKAPKTTEEQGNDPSYAFGGPVSTTAAGHPVPLLYGQRRVGGAYISASITAERYV